MSHKHWFTALWWHFGPFGPQDVHVHSCLHESCGEHDCDRVLVGPGRDCAGQDGKHERMTLTESGPRKRALAMASGDD